MTMHLVGPYMTTTNNKIAIRHSSSSSNSIFRTSAANTNHANKSLKHTNQSLLYTAKPSNIQVYLILLTDLHPKKNHNNIQETLSLASALCTSLMLYLLCEVLMKQKILQICVDK